MEFLKRSISASSHLINLLRINPETTHTMLNILDLHAVSTAVDILREGGVIAVPTDTLYGLACSATNTSGINKLYDIKKRDENKPVAICIGKVSDIPKWAHISHLSLKLLSALLPGPVTLILNCTKELNPLLVCNNKIGIRVPNYPFILDVCNKLNCPIALTSANRSSEPSTVSVDEFKVLWPQLSGIFDGGIVGKRDGSRDGSTVVDLSEIGFYKIIRNGIAFEETVQTLENFGLVKK